jgi:hypothetical protein
VPGIWLQFSHIEREYYDGVYKPALIAQQAAHNVVWGSHEPGDETTREALFEDEAIPGVE